MKQKENLYPKSKSNSKNKIINEKLPTITVINHKNNKNSVNSNASFLSNTSKKSVRDNSKLKISLIDKNNSNNNKNESYLKVSKEEKSNLLNTSINKNQHNMMTNTNLQINKVKYLSNPYVNLDYSQELIKKQSIDSNYLKNSLLNPNHENYNSNTVDRDMNMFKIYSFDQTKLLQYLPKNQSLIKYDKVDFLNQYYLTHFDKESNVPKNSHEKLLKLNGVPLNSSKNIEFINVNSEKAVKLLVGSRETSDNYKILDKKIEESKLFITESCFSDISKIKFYSSKIHKIMLEFQGPYSELESGVLNNKDNELAWISCVESVYNYEKLITNIISELSFLLKQQGELIKNKEKYISDLEKHRSANLKEIEKLKIYINENDLTYTASLNNALKDKLKNQKDKLSIQRKSDFLQNLNLEKQVSELKLVLSSKKEIEQENCELEDYIIDYNRKNQEQIVNLREEANRINFKWEVTKGDVLSLNSKLASLNDLLKKKDEEIKSLSSRIIKEISKRKLTTEENKILKRNNEMLVEEKEVYYVNNYKLNQYIKLLTA